MITANNAMQNLPAYLFARIERKIAQAQAEGRDVINLGIGDPDIPTPKNIIDTIAASVYDTENHRYPSSVGLLAYRQAVAGWYKKRFDVELDPEKEVVSLLGSKEGLAHVAFAFLNPGDISLIPDPAYPVYNIATLLANGQPYILPLTEENKFLPQFSDIPSEAARRAKLLFINYPNNPTGAVCDIGFFNEAVEFAKSYDILVCHDAAYSEISFDGLKMPSFMQAEGAKEVGIEFHSLSKTYNMTGWRIGWIVGNKEAIEIMGRFKSNVDSGVFQPVQYAAIEALSGPQDSVSKMKMIYQERRDEAIKGLERMGWKIDNPRASFYLWAKVPPEFTSDSFAKYILEKSSVVITPGNGYGKHGEGYFRIALTADKARIAEAFERMYSVLGKVSF